MANVDTKAQWVKDQEPMWRRAADLQGGTEAMRAAGIIHLPKFEEEPNENYQSRLLSSFLTNYYEAMLKGIIGAMTGEEITVDEACKLDKAFLANVDRQGSNLNTFAKLLLFSLLTKGASHILTDYPKNPGVETYAEQQAAGLRPYWAAIQPETIIDALTKVEAGIESITHVRWMESAVFKDGWERKTRDTIRILDIPETVKEGEVAGQVRMSVWKRTGTDAFVEDMAEARGLSVERGKALQTITISPILADRKGAWKSKAPMDDIAFKNIEHWQSSSDQRNILRLSRFPMRTEIGTAAPAKIMGPGVTLHSVGRQSADGQDVEFGYIEPEGNGIEAGERDLKRIAEEIEAMGLRLFTRSSQRAVADAESDAEKDKSPLQMLAETLERGLTVALQHAAIWYGLAPEQGGKAIVPKDFGLSAEDAKAVDALLKMRQARDISQTTLWAELRARSYLKTSFTDADERQRIADEGDALDMPDADPFARPNVPPKKNPADPDNPDDLDPPA